MLYFNVFTQEIAAIILFFYAIESFSKLILHENLEKIKGFFAKYSNTDAKAILTGIVSTLVLQSSTAVSTLSVSLVNAGVFRVTTAMPIIFGAGIGTSSTAFLVSLKIKWLEEIVIIISFLISLTKKKHLAKIIFYLGLLLFAIEQMSLATSVLKDSEGFRYIFKEVDDTGALFAFGIILTIILQSSTLMTSILVVLILQKGIKMESAMIICIGAFVGTTLTSLVVSLRLSSSAKQVGILNASLSLIAASLNLVFVELFVDIGYFFKNSGLGLAIGNTVARIFCCISSLLLFKICTAILAKKGRAVKFFKKFKKLEFKKAQSN
jgi:phosphate:Na+ symporter